MGIVGMVGWMVLLQRGREMDITGSCNYDSMRVKTSATTTDLCLRFPSVFQPNSLFIYAACLLTGSLWHFRLALTCSLARLVFFN